MSRAAFANAVAERQRGDCGRELASSAMSRAAFANHVAERQRGDGGSEFAGSPMNTARWVPDPSTAGEEDA
jgi:hypothetical protein